jgi:agmatinase
MYVGWCPDFFCSDEIVMIEKPYEGFATFLKSPIGDLSRKIGVFGIPYDGSSSFRPGSRFGPKAIREASMMLTDGAHPILGVDPAPHVTDLGDISVSNIDVEKSLNTIVETVSNHPMFLLDTARLMFMGGDHTISLALLEVYSRKFEDIALLHFDAHCDTWAEHFGDPIGHGTWVRNVVESGFVKAENIMQIGIRSPVDPATRDWLSNRGGTVISAREAMRNAGDFHGLSLRDGLDKRNVYVSFDIDALDPAYAPGTGTPEIAGLTPHFVLDLFENLSGANFIGMDIVEVSPPYDPTGTTALTAATLLWTMASIWSLD